MASLKKRGKVYYAQYYIGGKAYRKSLETTSLQIAKEKLRQIESRMARGDDLPIPTRTPIAGIVQEYIGHIQQHKTRSAVRSDL